MELKYDLTQGFENESINLVELDNNTETYNISFYTNNFKEVYTLTDKEVKFVFIDNHKRGNIVELEKVDDKAILKVSNVITARDGEFFCQFNFSNAAGFNQTTKYFKIKISNNLFQELTEVIVGTDLYKQLIETMKKVTELDKSFTENLVKLETALELAQGYTKFTEQVIQNTNDIKRIEEGGLENIGATYIPYAGEYIVAKNTYNGLVKDLIVKGNTIKNCITKYRKPFISDSKASASSSLDVILYANQVYTIIATGKNISKGYLAVTENAVDIKICESNTFSTVFKFTSSKNTTQVKLGIFAQNSTFTQEEIDNFKINIIEGDVVANPPNLTTSFPLTSVGQSEDGVIRVKTTGKNLIDKAKITFHKGYVAADGYFESSITESISISNMRAGRYTFSKYIPTNRFSIGIFKGAPSQENKDYVFIHGTIPSNISHTFTVNKGYDTIVICLNHKNGDMPIDINDLKLQLEEGDISTEYEEYKESVVQVQLPFDGGLKGVIHYDNKLYSDTVKFNHNTISIVQKFKKITVSDLIGRLHLWQHSGNDSKTVLGYGARIPDAVSTGDFVVYCNKIKNRQTSGVDDHSFYVTNTEVCGGFKSNDVTTQMLGFSFCKSRAKTPLEVIEYLKQKEKEGDPYEFWYELETPIIHEIPIQNLSTFKAITTLAIETEVPANIECKIPSDSAAIISDLQTKNNMYKNKLDKIEETQNNFMNILLASNLIDKDGGYIVNSYAESEQLLL